MRGPWPLWRVAMAGRKTSSSTTSCTVRYLHGRVFLPLSLSLAWWSQLNDEVWKLSERWGEGLEDAVASQSTSECSHHLPPSTNSSLCPVCSPVPPLAPSLLKVWNTLFVSMSL